MKLCENKTLSQMQVLRRDILDSPVSVDLDRARTFTRVWQETEGAPWVVRKALALREHLATVPLYLRPYDLLAGSISGTPGAMPVMVELGIAENGIYVSEHPERRGYLAGAVPRDIRDYWKDRNLWGEYRGYLRTVHGEETEVTEVAGYKFLSNQGHLSPSYRELLDVGLDGLLKRVLARRGGESDPETLTFLSAAENVLRGLSTWIERYAVLIRGEEAQCSDTARARELADMAVGIQRVAHHPPQTFHQAMQLIWFAHQAIHMEGHGYSNTPDRLDQLLYPFYLKDKADGRLDDDRTLTLCENFILKQRDNTVWGIEHNLTQGLVVSGSTPDGADQTNELSWLFIQAAGAMSVPEPLVWLRWHESIPTDFFDFCLENLAGSTCFPLMMSDTVVPQMFMELGVSREDAFDYVPVGCNEIGIPGKAYFNPNAGVNYLAALESAITGGSGLSGEKPRDPGLPPTEELTSFEALTAAVGRVLERQIESSYGSSLGVLGIQMRRGQTPLTSVFFEGCLERGRDMVLATKYNILTCGGNSFPNMVDSLAAIREVVYRHRQATLEEVAQACRENFVGHEDLRRQLQQVAKHGNDDDSLDDIVTLVQRLRDEPLKRLCRDPRDGTPFGNTHIVRSSAVRVGRVTPATPDGRLAGTPLASSVAASCSVERQGPTATLNSILKLDAVHSWQSGYNVNMRFQHHVLADAESRGKVAVMLGSFFKRGGQEMQINSVDSATLRAAQENPEQYRDIVVRVAGFSDFFVNLTEDLQEEVISRTEHDL